MKETPTRFCPDSCLFKPDGDCPSGCYHRQDREVKPRKIQTLTGGRWVDANIVGTCGNEVYIDDGSSIFSVMASSPLIR